MTLEELRDAHANLQKDYEALKTQNDKANQDNADYQKRIKELEDYNRKLFMQIDFSKEAKANDKEAKPTDEAEILKGFCERKY